MVAIKHKTTVDFFMANSSKLVEQVSILCKNRQIGPYTLGETQLFQIQPFFCTFDCPINSGMKPVYLQQSSLLRIASIGAVALLCSVLFSCEIEQTKIPNCDVYLRRNIYNEGLVGPSTFLYVTTPNSNLERLGYGGIVVIHREDLQEPYCAFDIACPNCVSPSIRVSKPDSMTLVSTCPNCGEHYDLFFGIGNPLKRISKVGMKKYTTYSDDRYIVVEP